MSKATDLTGRRFGKWVVLHHFGRIKSDVMWVCQCDCGTIRNVATCGLLRGSSTSCRCATQNRLTHGHAKKIGVSLTYSTYRSMLTRCTNSSNRKFTQYGGIGITICDRWLESFENFLADMGERPSKDHTIDRYPNQKGNYEPGNCRWATWTEQNRNRSSNRVITIGDESLCVIEWAERFSINKNTIAWRISRGWNEVLAVTNPVQVQSHVTIPPS